VAYEVPGFKFTRIAAADLSARQFRFVNIDNTGKAAMPAAGGRAIAVLQNKPGSGQACELMFSGISKVEAGAAVTAGDNVATDVQGRAVLSATGNTIIGIALESASGPGIVIPVLLYRVGGLTP
jgi:hypothetical protein